MEIGPSRLTARGGPWLAIARRAMVLRGRRLGDTWGKPYRPMLN
jgi:hypothetical protein